ncbi:unnamed protein product [Coregonus sp. 'balchen']|nr:unnamed protein product [Coregonus sp. 'balchen']
MDLYRIPTDRKSLFRGDSFHPTPLKKSLPISQYIHRVTMTNKRTMTISLKKHCHILSTDPQLENTPRVVFRRAPNISQMVVRSDLPPVPRSTFLDNVLDSKYRCG